MGALPSTLNLNARNRNVQNIKDKGVDQPAKKKKKKRDTLTPYRTQMSPPVELRCLETNNLHKCVYMCDVLCSVIERIV